MATTKMPTGVKLDRARNKITASWKQAEKYNKQKVVISDEWFYDRTQGALYSNNLFNGNVSASKSEKSVNLDLSKYYPNKIASGTNAGKYRYLNYVYVEVRGKVDKKDWSTDGGGKEGNGWKGFSFDVPEKVYVGIARQTSNQTYFVVSLNYVSGPNIDKTFFSDSNHMFITGIQCQTILRLGTNDTNTSILNVPESQWTDLSQQSSGAYTSRNVYNSADKSNTTEWDNLSVTETASQQTQITNMLNQGKTATRWFRARAVGPAGPGEWNVVAVPYASAKPVTNIKSTFVEVENGGYDVTVDFDFSYSINSPIDSIKIQYSYAEPTNSSLDPPTGASWNDAPIGGDNTITPPKTNSSAITTEHITKTFTLPYRVDEGELIYIKIVTIYNNIETNGWTVICRDPNGELPATNGGLLEAPSGLVLTVPTGQTNRVTVTVTNNCDVDDAFLVVEYEDPSTNTIVNIGIITLEGTGEESETFQHPPNSTGEYSISVYVAVGTYEATPHTDYTSYEVNAIMRSRAIRKGGNVPIAPQSVNVEHLGEGNVRVTWEWNWQSAEIAEIGWSDYQYAIGSTNPPQTYQVTNVNTASIIIADLEMGKTWYFWVRFQKRGTYSRWSDYAYLSLNSAPNVAYVDLSEYFITTEGVSTLTWSYVTTDTTPQASATIAEGTYENGIFTTTKIIGLIPNDTQSKTEQRFILDPKIFGWEDNTEHYISVKVASESGRESEEWAEPALLTIIPKLECEITQTSLVDSTNPDITCKVLKELPLSVTITGSGSEVSQTVISIERLTDYFINRPDGDYYGGYAGETIFYTVIEGQSPVSINQEDIFDGKYLDDDAYYIIRASITDGYGQVAEDTVEFIVSWTHQALYPNAVVTMIPEYLAVEIDIEQPEGWDEEECEGDVCDIYRSHMDGYTLIYKDAEIGKQYVDPYPTLGDKGGYRIVYRTKNGDTIVNEVDGPRYLAWLDLTSEDIGYIDSDRGFINFESGSVDLMYNVDQSSSWEKNFQETKYLGGSIQGDWIAGVSKTGSIKTSVVTNDNDMIQSMHMLAEHEGPCHIRTRDGSNYIANVSVSEDLPYQEYYDPYDDSKFTQLGSYTLTITRIDNTSDILDGITLLDFLDSIGVIMNRVGYSSVGILYLEEE